MAAVVTMGLTDADGLALTMLMTILFSFSVVGMLVACMVRNAARQDTEVERLLEEIADEEKLNAGRTRVPQVVKREAWEKDGDWWKGNSCDPP